MPGEDGLSLTKTIRKNTDQPILLLTARGEPEDRIAGLETGADDYLPKPFHPKELLLRINNILNKVEKKILPEEINIGDSSLNLKKLILKNNEKVIKINPTESKVLEKMISKKPIFYK